MVKRTKKRTKTVPGIVGIIALTNSTTFAPSHVSSAPMTLGRHRLGHGSVGLLGVGTGTGLRHFVYVDGNSGLTDEKRQQ